MSTDIIFNLIDENKDVILLTIDIQNIINNYIIAKLKNKFVCKNEKTNKYTIINIEQDDKIFYHIINKDLDYIIHKSSISGNNSIYMADGTFYSALIGLSSNLLDYTSDIDELYCDVFLYKFLLGTYEYGEMGTSLTSVLFSPYFNHPIIKMSKNIITNANNINVINEEVIVFDKCGNINKLYKK